MLATKVTNRDIYEITYDGSSGEGLIDAELTNPETGDVSNYAGADDGKFIVTVSTGYVGGADVVVSKDGEVVDEGSVTYGTEEDGA